jgi:hypothetical protein
MVKQPAQFRALGSFLAASAAFVAKTASCSWTSRISRPMCVASWLSERRFAGGLELAYVFRGSSSGCT